MPETIDETAEVLPRFVRDDRRVLDLELGHEETFFDLRHLRSLVEGSLLAIRVSNFYATSDATSLAGRLLGAPWETYGEEISIGRVGVPLFDCLGETRCETYFEAAPRSRAAIQTAVAPWANPADLISRELDLGWPAGCGTLKIGGRTCFVGLPRAFSNGGQALPHTDRCDWDLPCRETSEIQAQIAFNLYLAVSEHGGQLELWNWKPSRAEYQAIRQDYGLRREGLGQPELILRPRPGDLILFNASRVHAVRPSTGAGKRVTLSGFIGYRGPDRGLVVFS